GRGNWQPEKITRTAGEEVNITFVLEPVEPTKIIKSVNLYKNSKKIGECLHMAKECTYPRGMLKTVSRQVIVAIANLSVNDSGNYSVTFFLQSTKNFIPTKPVCLTMIFANDICPFSDSSGSVIPEDPHQEAPTSRSFSYIYIIFALALSIMMLPALLLSWFYLTPRKSSGQELSPRVNNEYQVTGNASRAAPLRSTEYGVLEFPTVPERTDKAEHCKETVDSVEYATITFSLVDAGGTMLGQKTSHWST
ncbi:hypothetical protein GN956_G16380, partial [Arapaima gigas]